jgi:hypothetical protein
MVRHIYDCAINSATDKVATLIGKGIDNTARLYALANWLRYTMNKKKSEAFFEKGRLYFLAPQVKEARADLILYSIPDIEFAMEEAERGDLTPFLLKKPTKRLIINDLFMLIEIKRYRFDYCILKVLVGDQMYGIILYGNTASYPWELFIPVS